MGEWVVVYGCGGVGFFVIMIVNVMGVNVIVVDFFDDKLEFVKKLGVVVMVNVCNVGDVLVVICELMLGGVYVLVDVFGYLMMFFNFIFCLCCCGCYV